MVSVQMDTYVKKFETQPRYQILLKNIIDLNLKPKTIKLLGETFVTLGL